MKITTSRLEEIVREELEERLDENFLSRMFGRGKKAPTATSEPATSPEQIEQQLLPADLHYNYLKIGVPHEDNQRSALFHFLQYAHREQDYLKAALADWQTQLDNRKAVVPNKIEDLITIVTYIYNKKARGEKWNAKAMKWESDL